MEENTNLENEQVADQHDAFLAGWDDEVPTEAADQQAEDTDETQEEVTEEAEAEAATETETTEQEQTEETSEEPTASETTETTWNVKVLGEDKTVKAADITAELLQKGYDYDRIRTKYDEAKPVMEMFNEFAKKAGMTVAEYAKHIRTAAKKADGLSDAEAERAIDLEDREAAVSAKETEQREAENAKNQQNEKINADIQEFAKAFPDVFKEAKDNPQVIPKSVWDDVHNNGMSLTSAYAKYTVAQANEAVKSAQAQAATAVQNAKNAQRSTGSMKSAGNDVKVKDAFLEGWDS